MFALKTPLPTNSTIGIMGGGQLGRMLALAAARLGFKTHIFTPEINSPAAQVSTDQTVANYDDQAALEDFAKCVDVVTFEFENIPVEALDIVAEYSHVAPSTSALEVTQDRYHEKTFLQELNIPTAPFYIVGTRDELEAALQIEHTGILKTRRFGYDGKGQVRINSMDAAAQALEQLNNVPCILEGFINFTAEFSVIAARDYAGEVVCYDPAENVHKDHILYTSCVPASLSSSMLKKAIAHTRHIMSNLSYIGVLGVEFFALPDETCIVNELAPRVHNSGHWTMNACVVDQFENHIRAICGWPLGNTQRHSDAIMQNLIGNDVMSYTDISRDPDACIHLYGKQDIRPGRKMGHVVRIKSPL